MITIPSPIFSLDKDIKFQESNYTLTINKDNSVASLQLNSSDWNHWQNNGLDYGTTTNKTVQYIYNHFKDDFDFIVFVSNNARGAQKGIRYSGRHIAIKQDVKGLGKSTYDYTSRWHSDGKLQSIVHLPELNYIEIGPFLHEFAHHWANSYIESNVSGHFGDACVGLKFGGQLGGCAIESIESLGNNQYRLSNGRNQSTSFHGNSNGGNGVPYSELELYLMGFIPKEDVPNIVFFENLNKQGSWPNFTYHASKKTERTIENLIQTHGARIPNSTESQKRFKILTVVLTPQALSNSQWSTINRTVEDMNSKTVNNDGTFNFYEATGGRGELDMINLSRSVIGQPDYSSSSEIISSSSEGPTPIEEINSPNFFELSFIDHQISLNLKESSDIEVNIFDLRGKELVNIKMGQLSEGQHKLGSTLNPRSLLIYKIKINGHDYVGKIKADIK